MEALIIHISNKIIKGRGCRVYQCGREERARKVTRARKRRRGEERGGRQVVASTRGRELSSDTFSESNAAQYSVPQPEEACVPPSPHPPSVPSI